MRHLILFVIGIGFGWAVVDVVRMIYKHRQQQRRERYRAATCRCLHSKFEHFGGIGYCYSQFYDRTGQQPDCPCGVFTDLREGGWVGRRP